MLFNKRTSSPIVPIIIALLTLLILGGVFWYSTQEQQGTSNSSDSSQVSDRDETQTDVSLTIDEDPATSGIAPAPGITPGDNPENVLTPLLGTQTGTAQFLTSSLEFPEAGMTVNPDDTFVLEVSGLDLATLNNPDLAVEDTYPVLAVSTFGAADVVGAQEVELNIYGLTPSLSLISPEGERSELDPVTQAQILDALATEGVVLPEVSQTNPAILPVTVTTDTESAEVASTSESELFLLFRAD